ncbi:uncharacterized protein EV154DRAFT_534264 [Mucor mucedo]|uniref:uncharacterized protein n=1 Tax=Mucor mucedo TaxID=29922 RepID=UPI0022206433|nr:uncharacterized protein EV154DRAFT_534264 [Mucor mucedo]KAI7864095.1 hypothetical protein EV154DRAFT_534264 [Mucor mucedo]
MLPLYDANLDTQAFNIFKPVNSLLSYDLPKLSVEIVDKPSTSSKSNPISFKKPEVDLYCKPCKKKFSNEPTFANHLKSAKHIANETKAQPAKTARVSRIPVNPQVQDALSQLEIAASADPTTSLTIYWNQAQLLFSLKRPQYVEKALKSIINLLLASPPTQFSSAQITSFLYSSRLALARLLCIYQELDESRSIYLDALDGKWKLEKNELLDIAKRLHGLSTSVLLSACDTLAAKYLTRERNRTKPAPALADINNSITTILNEAGNLFAQEQHTYDNVPSENIALVLYATCSLITPFEKLEEFPVNYFYNMMNQVYESLEGLDHRMVEVNLLLNSDVWYTFTALLLSLEIDDLIRARCISQSLKQEAIYSHPDVKLLCDLCDNKLTLNQHELLQDLSYVKLLLNETDEPLLIRSRDEGEQEYTLDRIADLI